MKLMRRHCCFPVMGNACVWWRPFNAQSNIYNLHTHTHIWHIWIVVDGNWHDMDICMGDREITGNDCVRCHSYICMFSVAYILVLLLHLSREWFRIWLVFTLFVCEIGQILNDKQLFLEIGRRILLCFYVATYEWCEREINQSICCCFNMMFGNVEQFYYIYFLLFSQLSIYIHCLYLFTYDFA